MTNVTPASPTQGLLTTQQIRRQFLDFFISKGHTEVSSSSLVPGDDPTLLFTNAGMNQFKDVFLGTDIRAYKRAVSSQRCVRAGGKHNDLENVGFTARHHTFFEMLGNFSFGDYFKEDAIKYAWELLTEVYKLPKEKLTVTVYDTDDEAYNLWKDMIGVPEARIIRIGDKKDGGSDNFWQMGDTGPCGPCTEIFYDHGADIWGGPPGSADEDGDRFIEIWNLVFMQFNRDEKGVLHPLPKPSVDTGMGLERLAAVLQHVHSNYEIDLFQNLIQAAATAVNVSDLSINSLKVIADHIRSVAFLICDGVLPSNEGRGYVLRRIMRRAIRHGYKLGQKNPFFHKLVSELANQMGQAFPELISKQAQIESVILQEETRFAKTLEHGLKLLEADIAKLKTQTLAGETIFKLYDTYGFPVDLTNDIARELKLELDMDGFDACMKKQQDAGRSGGNFSSEKAVTLNLSENVEFTGYNLLETTGKVIALVKEGLEVQRVETGDECIIVLDKTPFYGESGGQVGDTGSLHATGIHFAVTDTRKQGNNPLHVGTLTQGTLSLGDSVTASVDVQRRINITLNHSATHLLHKALRDLLGAHVEQKGSLVDGERLRFDFSHNQGVTAAEIAQIESTVNAQIRQNNAIAIAEMAIDDAKQRGAMALFGEKYGDEVRVVEMGDYSIELCGGTHTTRTGNIGLFKIISEAGIASGIRRIEAVTGEHAIHYIHTQQNLLVDVCEQLKSDPARLSQKTTQVLNELKTLEKNLVTVKGKLALAASNDLLTNALTINGVTVIIAELPELDAKSVRDLAEHLRDKSKGITLIGSVLDGKASLVAGVAKELTAKIKAGDLVNVAAALVGGKGGGRPECAMAGGTEITQLPAALVAAQKWLEEKL